MFLEPVEDDLYVLSAPRSARETRESVLRIIAHLTGEEPATAKREAADALAS